MTFPHLATIQQSIKSNGKYTYGGTTTVACFLQPMDATAAQLYGISYAKAFNCFLPYTASVTDKMRLVIDGQNYGVRGVKNHTYGSLKHKQALLELV